MNLSLCPICGKLSEEEQTALFSSLDYSTRSFEKGDWVARQGDALSSLYLLSKGRVKTEMITESGTILEVETLSAPTPLASAFLFAENNRFPVDVIALEECEIILIPKNAVMRLLATNEHFLQSYMAFNANRTQFLSHGAVVSKKNGVYTYSDGYTHTMSGGSNWGFTSLGDFFYGIGDLFAAFYL